MLELWHGKYCKHLNVSGVQSSVHSSRFGKEILCLTQKEWDRKYFHNDILKTGWESNRSMSFEIRSCGWGICQRFKSNGRAPWGLSPFLCFYTNNDLTSQDCHGNQYQHWYIFSHRTPLCDNFDKNLQLVIIHKETLCFNFVFLVK